MKIATNTLIVVLVCLLGAAASAGVMAVQYQAMESAQESRERASLVMRDFGHLQSFFSQWLVAIDLFYTGKQTYLGNGIQRQSGEIVEILASVRGIGEPLIGNATMFTRIEQAMSLVTNEIDAIAVDGESDESAWNASLNRTDVLTMNLIADVENLVADSESLAARSGIAFVTARDRFNTLFWVCSALYLSTVALTWLWANRNIVQPIVSLTQTATKEVSDEEDISFDVQQGPLEIRMLGERLQEFSVGMHRAHQNAQRNFLASERVRKRIDAIMNTAADGILTVTAENRIETANHAALGMLKLTEDRVVGQQIDRFVAQLSPHDELSGMPDDERLHLTDLRLTNADGIDIPVEVSVSQMRHEGNENFTVIVRDVTARKASEEKVKELHKQLVHASRQAGIAEVATAILHNAGNVINSVKTSISVIESGLRQSRLPGLSKSMELIGSPDKLSAIAAEREKASQFCSYLTALNEQLTAEQGDIASELCTLDEHVRHIESIIRSQQSNSKHSSVEEELILSEVFNDSLNMNKSDITNGGIETVYGYDEVDQIIGDRHKLALVMVNLIRNGADAILEGKPERPQLKLNLSQDDQQIYASVTDNGIGMTKETMENIFKHGFTTKKDGHGFGLHSCALEAKNMGGSLTFSSDGLGCGSTFTIILPRNSGELLHANG